MWRWACGAALLLCAACATRSATRAPEWPRDLPRQVELSATPFFAQARYQCGPAALATVLTAANVAVSPAALIQEVYLPARRGSLQTELLAATRRRERIPYVIVATSGELAAQVASGRPVLVLLNLGLDHWPRWHYAVVIGYDVDRGYWILRSGRTVRQTLSMRRFAGAWQRANHWGFVALDPQTEPVGDDPARWIAAVAGFESLGMSAVALRAYAAAARRWPSVPVVHFALANALAAQGRSAEAERALERTLELDPGHVPARNNLAELLAKRGCRDRALAEIEIAVRAAAGSVYEDAVALTDRSIRALPSSAEGCAP